LNERERKNLNDLNNLKNHHVTNLKDSHDKHSEEFKRIQKENEELQQMYDDLIKKLKGAHADALRKKDNEINEAEESWTVEKNRLLQEIKNLTE
jgi:uncharacterized protein YukE